MSHEAIVAAYAHTPDLGEAWGPLSQDTVVLAGIQVVCECGVIIMEESGDDLGFLPLSDVNHAVRAHQESA
jgi:hypothetical protein